MSTSKYDDVEDDVSFISHIYDNIYLNDIAWPNEAISKGKIENRSMNGKVLPFLEWDYEIAW